MSFDNPDDGDSVDSSDNEGWEDLEPDLETSRVRCLLCTLDFLDPQKLLAHCKSEHDLDIKSVQRNLSLDFLGTIKLVNYIRGEKSAGRSLPELSSYAAFCDESYLKPVLEDDALLYNLHEIIEETLDSNRHDGTECESSSSQKDGIQCDDRVKELEEKLRKAQYEIEARKKELESIKSQFCEAIEPDDHQTGNSHIKSACNNSGRPERTMDTVGHIDSSYFDSYSGHEIHETMLKDTVRTDAYRDFIYDNKDLFRGKTVLDVGCGTGILSMFCARAGAAKVIAVDNSDIINFARENIYKNGMAETVVCLRGKIEEVSLPVNTVDIIVSEWMGYCLLYEAMLDSVLWARDRYLKEDGIMVPSHCTLRLAPLTDTEYIDDHIHHWKNVYGFDMISMYRDIYLDVMVREIQDFSVPADSAPFFRLDLRRIATRELTFNDKPFAFELTADIEALDGFVIWFDTFFATEAHEQLPMDLKAEDCKRDGGGMVAFTTGPHGRRTHWQQGVLLIDHRGREARMLRKGEVIEGSIGYKKRQEDHRALDIEVLWQNGDKSEKGKQSWSMR